MGEIECLEKKFEHALQESTMKYFKETLAWNDIEEIAGSAKIYKNAYANLSLWSPVKEVIMFSSVSSPLEQKEKSDDDKLTKFRNVEELTEVCNLFNSKYPGSKFNIKHNAINCISDAYYDPILTLLAFRQRGLISASICPHLGELDEIEITECNLASLRKLKECWPDWKNVDEILDNLGYKKPEVDVTDTSPIILQEEESSTVIDRSLWNEYWRLKGKTGPDSGWEIPTAQQLYATLKANSIFSKKSDIKESLSEISEIKDQKECASESSKKVNIQ